MSTQSQTPFTHLHVHTEYSTLDAISKIPNLVDRAQQLGMDALAITDHGAMHGAVSFYSQCHEKGIKPIIGCEVYVAHASHRDRGSTERSPAHLTLLAQDDQGYRNLIQLVTRSHLDGFYYRPRIDMSLLAHHHAGIICLSGCPSGSLQRALRDQDNARAAQIANDYRDIFSNRYFLEIQRHQDVPDLERINHALIELANSSRIPLVATADSHYVTQDQHQAHQLYTAIQTDSDPDEEGGIQFKDNSYHLASPQEMTDWFPDLPAAIDNAYRIGQSCSAGIGYGDKHLPQFPVPDGLTALEYLTRHCEQGFQRRCPPDDPTYRQRLDYEMEVIAETQFEDYFLIVWDIIDHARKLDIKYSVRGSAAASLVLYCLDITNADPIEHRLVFERFLNKERKEMPDIDIDFPDDRRDEIIKYTTARYGHDRVAQIVTFNRYGAKSIVRAIARAKHATYARTEQITKAIPTRPGTTIANALDSNPRLAKMVKEDPQASEIIQQAQSLEGTVHHTSQHPAGVVIAPEPIENLVPLQRPPDNSALPDAPSVTQYSMDDVANLGMLKMDFLSLTNLTILDQVQRAVPDGPQSLNDIPLDDPDTYRLLSTGNTATVFQLESAGMQRNIRELRPTDLGDISAMIALFRPGPMQHIDRFINSKHGQTPPTYPHDSMKDILDETYGIIVYQDQVLQILQRFAGYTMGEADIVRKAMGKKIPALMQAERQRFLEFADRQGQPPDVARRVFDTIEPFAGYAFNKAHSISYALISYWTAWYKAHHPAPYMTAVINCRRGDNQKVQQAADECHRMGLRILIPCVNNSLVTAHAEDGAVRIGLQSIHAIPDATCRALVDERERGGPYQSLADFCQRSPRFQNRQLEMVVKAGGLDTLAPRQHCLDHLTEIHAAIEQEATTRESGQTNLFNIGSPIADQQPYLTPPDDPPEPDPATLAKMETEALGFPISRRLDEFLSRVAPPGAEISAANLASMPEGATVTVAGIIREIKQRTTRDGKPFLTVQLQMADGPAEVMVWPQTLENTREIWDSHAPISVSGSLSLRDQGPSISASSAAPVDLNRDRSTVPLHMRIAETDDPDADRDLLHRAIMTMLRHPGDSPVYIHISQRDGRLAHLSLPTVTTQADHPTLLQQLQDMELIDQPEMPVPS